MGEFFHEDFLAAKGHRLAGGAGGGEQGEFTEWEVPLFEAKEHFNTDGTSGTYDCDVGMIHGMEAGLFSAGRASILGSWRLAIDSFGGEVRA